MKVAVESLPHRQHGDGRIPIRRKLTAAPMPAADGHALFKHAAKAIAHQQSRAVTFVAKPDSLQAGSGCHLHLSPRDDTGSARHCRGGH